MKNIEQKLYSALSCVQPHAVYTRAHARTNKQKTNKQTNKTKQNKNTKSTHAHAQYTQNTYQIFSGLSRSRNYMCSHRGHTKTELSAHEANQLRYMILYVNKWLKINNTANISFKYPII